MVIGHKNQIDKKYFLEILFGPWKSYLYDNLGGHFDRRVEMICFHCNNQVSALFVSGIQTDELIQFHYLLQLYSFSNRVQSIMEGMD